MVSDYTLKPAGLKNIQQMAAIAAKNKTIQKVNAASLLLVAVLNPETTSKSTHTNGSNFSNMAATCSVPCPPIS